MTASSVQFDPESALSASGGRDALANHLRRWPCDIPVACATLGVTGRWAVVGRPTRVIPHTFADPAAPLEALDAALDCHFQCDRRAASADPPGPGWVVMLSYELGTAAEPRGLPTHHLWSCPAWTILRIEDGVAIDRTAGTVEPFGAPCALAVDAGRYEVGPFEPSTSRETYERAVARARAYTHAGDIFQANLAHRLIARFTGAPRAMAAQLFESLEPSFPGYIELTGAHGVHSAVISVSPELFLDVAQGVNSNERRIVTRPIKGTRPGSHTEDLLESHKDAAELAMIVDLMRNDLGRVAHPGSVNLEEQRAFEVHHGGRITHTSSTISATLRKKTTLGDVLRATMPPGSVTGAPKVRALQIIEELERPMFGMRRGAYCGAIGYLCDDGRLALNVGIRTLTLHAETGSTATHATGRLDMPVGAGIVADSEPNAEWEETLTKARPIVTALGSSLIV